MGFSAPHWDLVSTGVSAIIPVLLSGATALTNTATEFAEKDLQGVAGPPRRGGGRRRAVLREARQLPRLRDSLKSWVGCQREKRSSPGQRLHRHRSKASVVCQHGTKFAIHCNDASVAANEQEIDRETVNDVGVVLLWCRQWRGSKWEEGFVPRRALGSNI